MSDPTNPGTGLPATSDLIFQPPQQAQRQIDALEHEKEDLRRQRSWLSMLSIIGVVAAGLAIAGFLTARSWAGADVAAAEKRADDAETLLTVERRKVSLLQADLTEFDAYQTVLSAQADFAIAQERLQNRLIHYAPPTEEQIKAELPKLAQGEEYTEAQTQSATRAAYSKNQRLLMAGVDEELKQLLTVDLAAWVFEDGLNASDWQSSVVSKLESDTKTINDALAKVEEWEVRNGRSTPSVPCTRSNPWAETTTC